MFDSYKKLYSLLDKGERSRGTLVLGLLIVVAFVETLGVASIMPFIAVLTNPEVVDTNRYLSAIYRFFGFESHKSFLFFLGLAFFALLVTSLALKAIGIWGQVRFSHNRECAWGVRLVAGYLRQPYEWFLNRHSADLSVAILAEIKQVVTGSLFPAMHIVAHVLVGVFIMALLVAIDPFLSIVVLGVLGSGYALVAIAFQRRLKRFGIERKQANRDRYYVIKEAFDGIKDVKVAGLEVPFMRRFRKSAQILASRQISVGVIYQIPSFMMQALLFGGMLLMLLYLMSTYGGFQESLPIVALFAFGGYRLMPALQNIYRDISQLRFSKAALDSLCADFDLLQATPISEEGGWRKLRDVRRHLRQELQLRDVSYGYPGADRLAVNRLSLRIPAFHTVGFVGSTGSGKTTTVDLILGLLRPRAGSILIDGSELIDEIVRPWQRSLGYVPQHIFLSDDTVAGNIAFGFAEKDIDMAAVERAAKVANLHDFVIDELTEGYKTFVGERGVRLSGGQRQRIGIARALYHDPDVLILDEATSALDNLTEQAVMEAVHNLTSRKTIILIAHRLSTVRSCDCIFLIEHGELLDSGSYDELLAKNGRFRDMAEAV